MEHQINTFFEKYSAALTTFSAETISRFYQAPLAIYSDEGVMFVNKESDTLEFWEQGIKPYQKMGIVKAAYKIIMEEQLSEANFVCKVLWINYDASYKEVSKETNFYILTKKVDELKISGLIMMNK
jgi:hypothetical protein